MKQIVQVTEDAIRECNQFDFDRSTGFEVLERALKLSGMIHIAENVHKEALQQCLKSSQK